MTLCRRRRPQAIGALRWTRSRYVELRTRWPDLAAPMASMPPARRVRYALQQRAKQVHARLMWGRGTMLEVVRESEREAGGAR